MKEVIAIVTVSSFLLGCGDNGSPNRAMTPERMLAIVEATGHGVSVDGNAVEFSYESVPMVLIYDVAADRMRIVSPVVEVGDLEAGQLEAAMAANYHSVLDARYALSNDIVWAVFIHPLSDLSESLLQSAIRQVAEARLTFGGEYSSGVLVFGGGSEDSGTEA